MSMHGRLTDMAIAAMTDERRDELRAAAEMVAAVFCMSPNDGDAGFRNGRAGDRGRILGFDLRRNCVSESR